MNTAKKILLYDAECPLCQAYSSAFIKAGILQADERRTFSSLHNESFMCRVDNQRQGNEIPLVDANGGATIYGVDALLHLLGRRWPLVQRVFGKGALRRMAGRMYSFISDNRRIILARRYATLNHSCAPQFRLQSRVRFIVFCMCVAVFITAALGAGLAHALGQNIAHTMLAALLACGTGWLLQITAALASLRRSVWDYWGHLAMLQLLGVLVLLPGIAWLFAAPNSGLIAITICIAASSSLMLRGHIRRAALLGLSQRWTVLWAALLLSSAAATTLYYINFIYSV
jgi:predicted DCC family thiol-disulfide oxidoreductase YuxK